jgi:alpha-amylase
MNKAFQTVEWAHTTNIYEVNVRQYTPEGTFNAFAKHLPRLRDMGVQTFWFMPITPISLLNRKGTLGSYYACSDYVSINPEFGTLADFKKLVNKAHKLGFRVMIDWVANHTGWDHVWTKSNPDFFSKDEKGNFRPPFPDWEDVIHLNYENKGLRKAMIEAMKFWVKECDIDGFRCDMAHLVPLDFWKDARTELDTIKKLFWFAETEEVSYHEVFDATYAWELLHTLEKYWKHETDINGIDSVLFKYSSFFPTTALRVFFTSNHDENSHSGTEYERIGDAAVPFAVFCATWNSVPLIYSGQEIPMKDKRLDFFNKDIIPWSNEYNLSNFYKTLLNLRQTNPALRAGDKNIKTYRLETSDNARVFAYLKKNDQREVLVILNLSADDVKGEIIGEVVSGEYKNIFNGVVADLSSQKFFEMRKWGYLVYER